jgi:hypothetical protein
MCKDGKFRRERQLNGGEDCPFIMTDVPETGKDSKFSAKDPKFVGKDE